MLNLTHQALEKFDNQHDLERMCADILNSLGYRDVTPIAPRGGGDGGRDITYTTSDGKKGLACVTLRVDSDTKFNEDFKQRKKDEYKEYIFFTNQYLSSAQKLKYAQYCVNELDANFFPQDIEYIRSLLDSALQPVRSQWLHIDTTQNPKYTLKPVNLKRYSAAKLANAAADSYKSRHKDFLSKSNMAGVIPISLPSLGIKSTEEVLTDLKNYETAMHELKDSVSKVFSFNLLLMTDKADSNIEVQVRPLGDVRLTMDDSVIEIPEKPRRGYLDGTLAYPPSISGMDSRDDDEFYARHTQNGSIKSNLKSINPNQAKEVFDVTTFAITSTSLKGENKVEVEVIVYSSNLASPHVEKLTLDTEEADLIELKQES